MSFSRLVLILAAALTLSGCSMRGAVEDLNGVTSQFIQGQQTGLTSGATAHQVSGGYNVSVSLGSYTDGIQQTANGYTVYSGLQGSSSSDVVTEE